MAAVGGGTSPEDVPLDAEMLKVLAADSRRDILRLLKKRRMTLTELSSALDLKKATVLEHLQKLTAVGLVRRLEDERLWVYYELTPQGGRLVTPGKTRFYLVMAGIAAAALLVGGFATVALLHEDDRHEVPVTLLTSPPAFGNLPFQIEVDLGGRDPVGLTAWLLTPEEAARLRAGEEIVPSRPLRVAVDESESAVVQSGAPVPPGDYLLYVRTAEGEDNRDRLVPIRFAAIQVEGPLTVTRGLDSPRFAVLRDGVPTDGLLMLSGPGAGLLRVESGVAVLEPERLDRLPPGNYRLLWEAEDGTSAPVGRNLTVRDATLALSPLHVPEGRPVDLTLSLPGHEGPTPEVRLGGARLDVTPSLGAYRLRLPALAAGEAEVLVGRIHRTVTVHPDPQLSFRLRGEGLLDLSVADASGAPVDGAAVDLDGARVGTTDREGRVELSPPQDAVTLLKVTEPDGGSTTRALRFFGEGVSEVPGGLNVTSVQATPGGATAVVSNDGPAPLPVTVTARVGGVPADSESIHLEPRSSAAVRFAFQMPSAGGPVEVRAEALQRSPVLLIEASGEPREVAFATPAAEARDAVDVQPSLTTPAMTPPAMTTPPTQAPGTPSAFAPAPEVPFPWELALVAAALAALALRRRRGDA